MFPVNEFPLLFNVDGIVFPAQVKQAVFVTAVSSATAYTMQSSIGFRSVVCLAVPYSLSQSYFQEKCFAGDRSTYVKTAYAVKYIFELIALVSAVAYIFDEDIIDVATLTTRTGIVVTSASLIKDIFFDSSALELKKK